MSCAICAASAWVGVVSITEMKCVVNFMERNRSGCGALGDVASVMGFSKSGFKGRIEWP